MKDSFVVHADYIEDLPEENKAEFLMYIYNYGCKGIEPELKGLALTVWTKIKRRLDEDEATYNEKIKGNSAGGKKHTGNQYTRKKEMEVNGSDFQKAPSEWKSMEVNGSRGTEYVSVSDNESVNDYEGESEGADNPVSPAPSTLDYSKLQTEVFNKLQKHNESVPVESRIPVSNNILSFVQKEFRELLDVMRDCKPEEITQTVDNLLKSARQHRKKKYSWYWFLNDINDYKPGFFIDDTKPEKEVPTVDSFCQQMMGKPGFNLSLFLTNQSKWIAAGSPQGDAYLELQKTWGVTNAAS